MAILVIVSISTGIFGVNLGLKYHFSENKNTMKLAAVMIVLLGTASFSFAGVSTPEIDANSAASAIALVSGGLLVLRGRRKK